MRLNTPAQPVQERRMFQHKVLTIHDATGGVTDGTLILPNESLERILSDYGQQGWEIVAASPCKEGTYVFLKRTLIQQLR